MMKFEKWSCVFVCVVSLLAAVIMRSSIKDSYQTDSAREELIVPYFSEQSINMCNSLYQTLYDSPIIVVGKATGESRYVFKNFWQSIKVTDVIKGKDFISEHDTVKLTGCGRIGFTYDKNDEDKEKAGRTYVDTNFQDYMQKDHDYLVFISRKVEIGSDEVYELNTNAITLRYLDLSANNSYVCDVQDREDAGCAVLYKEVKGSEFVTNSERVLKKMYKIKQKLIQNLLEN